MTYSKCTATLTKQYFRISPHPLIILLTMYWGHTSWNPNRL